MKQKEDANKLLNRMSHAFARDEKDLGCTDAIRHDIKLTDDLPFRLPHRRVPPAQLEEFRTAVTDLLEARIIRESKSPYASPVVLVRKKDGGLRVCVDFRRLNAKTVRDSYPIPRITETLESLQGAKWFCSLDLQSGYLQVEMAENDKPKTAMTTPFGLFEYNRMPFGLTNAPATFQRLMERCLGGLNLKICLAYLDDIIVFAKSFEEMLERLEAVLRRLAEYNLKLKPSKCKLFQTKLSYLGHIVSREGVEPDPDKIASLSKWLEHPPKNSKELQTFLGFASYYRSFVRGFATIAGPLQRLVGQPKLTTTKNKGGTAFQWSDTCQKAFETLINILTSSPVLAFPDFTLPFVLHTDASGDGLGAALYQMQDGKLRVVAYGSRSLQASEKRYSAYRREFLALKWSVTEKFKSYLYGRKFQVVTDSNPLTYLLTTAKLSAADHRWLSSLAVFDFTISYRPGRSCGDADGLSRIPFEKDDATSPVLSDEEYIKPFLARVQNLIEQEDLCSSDEFQAICTYHMVGTTCPNGDVGNPAVEAIAMRSEAVTDTLHTPPMPPQTDLRTMSPAEWKKLQMEDPVIGKVREALQHSTTRNQRDFARNQQVLRLLKEKQRLELRDGILFRKRIVDGCEFSQLLLPIAMRGVVLKGLHDDIGHLGKDKTLDLLSERFYWPGMTRDVASYIKTCDRCIKRKTRDPPHAPMVPILATEPMELLAMDFLSIEKGKGGYENVLVVTDSFTKYAWAFPTRNQKAHTVAKILWENILVNYGFPQRLHSDQGKDFDCRLIKEMCKLANIEKTRTTPYHPQGNGQTERFNRTLLGMLGTLDAEKKTAWPDYVAPLVHAYNCTKHSSTGYSPYFLMFGRNPRLPIDVSLGLGPQKKKKSYSTFVENLRARLAHAYDLASRSMEKKAEANKRRYDTYARETSIQAGDRVLVRNLTPRGKHKLQDRWEDMPYEVVRRAGGLPVYWVRREGDQLERALHRNLLLPYELPRTRTSKDKQEHVDHNTHVRQPGDIVAPGELTDPLGEEDIDSFVVEITSGGGNTTNLSVVAPPFYPTSESPEANVDEFGGDDPDANHVSLVDSEITQPNQLTIPVVQSIEDAPLVSDLGDVESQHDAAQVDQPDRPIITRSGRTSKPPERLAFPPAWCHKASVLLSLATTTNEHIIQKVLLGWLINT